MIIDDKKELTKLCSYIVMGDGGLYKKGNGNARFLMNMKKENLDYVELCRDVLENITSCSIKDRKLSNNDGCIRKEQVTLSSKNHPFFTTLRTRIYIDKYKGIDPHALKLLDYEALSFLYMSNGSASKYLRPEIGMINPSYRVTLNMKRLSYGDQLILKKALKEKLDLEWNIGKQNQYYYLNLRTKDIPKFMDNIEKFITPSFNYKILDVNSQLEDEIV